MKANFFFVILLSGSLLFAGCNADDGPQGPKGAKGDTGPAGAQGAKGAPGDAGNTGAAGANGNSNVYFNSSTGGGIIPAGANRSVGILFDVSMIKFSDVEKSLILLYFKIGDVWYKVPGDVPSTTGIQSLALAFHRHTDGGVVFRITRTNNAGALTYQDGKVVVIKQGTAGVRQGAVNYENYQEVKQYYSLQD